MRGPLTLDDVEELEARARTPEQRRTAAAQLTAWAQEVHPDDEWLTPAVLLVHAGGVLGLAGDHEAALVLFQRAVAAEGHAPPDIRCYLHHGLLKVGDTGGARRLAEEVRRSRPTDPDVYLLIGENYELADDLAEANRWLTMGMLRATRDPTDRNVVAERSRTMLVNARRRVRRALGFPPDDYDAIAVAPPGDD